jgi:hypothetical protein
MLIFTFNPKRKVNGIPVEMGHMVKPGDVVNFDGAVLTPEKRFIFY